MLEADLVRLNVCRDDWLSILLSKLPPKARDVVSQISCEPSCTYLDVKKLLDEVGLDIKSVENQLFVEWKSIAKTWDMVSRLEKLKVLVDRFTLGAKSVEELSLRLLQALYKVDLSTAAIAVLVGKNIKTFTDLSEVASILKQSGEKPLSCTGSENCGSNPNSSSREKSKSGNFNNSYKCFKCGRMGHRSFECRVRVENFVSSRKPVCYSCSQPGHVAADCPDKVKENPHKSGGGRGKSDTLLRTKLVSTRGDTVTIEGMVNGIKAISPEPSGSKAADENYSVEKVEMKDG